MLLTGHSRPLKELCAVSNGHKGVLADMPLGNLGTYVPGEAYLIFKVEVVIPREVNTQRTDDYTCARPHGV